MKFLIAVLLLAGVVPSSQAAPLVLSAESFGAIGDGVADDGPAVQRMLEAAAQVTGDVELRFASNKTFFLKSGKNRYAFWLDGAHRCTLDGGGSLFLIDDEQRFLKMSNCRDMTVRRFKVDYRALPFADGTVTAKNAAEGTIDVRIDADMALPPLGEATREDGEQAYFAVLWHAGEYSTPEEPYYTREHFWLGEVRGVQPDTDTRVVRLVQRDKGNNAALFERIEVGQWRVSVPVRGVAHRQGPGENCAIIGNENVTFEDVEMWSAPWFAFGVTDNTGTVTFRRTNVRPKPGTARLASSWRDGFHVKNNAATLLFEDCIVQGTGDDAFNIACHTSTALSVASAPDVAQLLMVRQNFPLNIARFRPGDTLTAYHRDRGVLLGSARITSVREAKAGSIEPPVAPIFEIALAEPIVGLEGGSTLVWNATTANPQTTLRRCRMDTSCRFRSPLTLEECRLNALVWFTGDEIEAPVPSNISVKRCVFRLGQGNPQNVVIVNGPRFNGRGPAQPVIFDVLFESNRIWGDFRLSDAARVVLRDNDFADARRAIALSNVADVHLEGNRRGGKALNDLAGLQTGLPGDAAQITFNTPPSRRKANK